MTINKSQGQTIGGLSEETINGVTTKTPVGKVGIILDDHVFAHGQVRFPQTPTHATNRARQGAPDPTLTPRCQQLYVALSRAVHPSCVRIRVPKPADDAPAAPPHTTNVVYRDVIEMGERRAF